MIHLPRPLKIPTYPQYEYCKTLKCGCVVNMFNQINIKKDKCYVFGWGK